MQHRDAQLEEMQGELQGLEQQVREQFGLTLTSYTRDCVVDFHATLHSHSSGAPEQLLFQRGPPGYQVLA